VDINSKANRGLDKRLIALRAFGAWFRRSQNLLSRSLGLWQEVDRLRFSSKALSTRLLGAVLARLGP
jgi:hypothetical protein